MGRSRKKPKKLQKSAPAKVHVSKPHGAGSQDSGQSVSKNSVGSSAAQSPSKAPSDPLPTPRVGIDDGYGRMHQIVLQGMLGAGVLDGKGVKRLFYGACTYLHLSPVDRSTMAYIQKIVREINETTKPYDFCIKSVSCEMTGKKYYIFLVTVERPILKMQTIFSPFELELFNMALTEMFTHSDTFSIPIMEMINFAIVTRMRGNVQDAENFMNRMIKQKYFIKTEIPGRVLMDITLGFRGIREFEPVLKELYSGMLVACFLCKHVLLHGLVCPDCRLVVHRGCYKTYMLGKQKHCPNCNTLVWADEDKILTRTRDMAVLDIALGSDPDSEYEEESEDEKEKAAREKQSRMSDSGSGPAVASVTIEDIIRILPSPSLDHQQSDDDGHDASKENSSNRGDDDGDCSEPDPPMPVLERMTEPDPDPTEPEPGTSTGECHEYAGRYAVLTEPDSKSESESNPPIKLPGQFGRVRRIIHSSASSLLD